MIENLAYVAIGFASTFLALEAAWHFTACKIKDKTIKPCFYFMNSLKKIAYSYGIAVVVTNHVHTVPDRYFSSDTSDSNEPVGGYLFKLEKRRQN